MPLNKETKPRKTNINTKKKMKLKIINRIMSEKKTTLPTQRNQDWKTVKAETEKKNKKRIINTYLNVHHRIKPTHLCRSEISQW